ncbi:MAG: hypothetical protein DRQ88_08220 [Epsilonproteobacteria bacterium]|nr:MAG: hypothetical protein DRQ89_08955 [Campylobacterota bacterium]RLA65973.1 MAG: hypothetical protein DRQ88_08220 [Campylobacterota bacterium]
MKFILLNMALLLSFKAYSFKSLPTASFVDLKRYIGKWYVITSLPRFYTKRCLGQIADYKFLPNGNLHLKNTCIKKGSRNDSMEGEGIVINKSTNAEIEVEFDNFFTKLFGLKGDYTIIKLDPDYNYAMVGDKKRKTLWIMSREREIPDDVLNAYVKFARGLGFETDKLKKSKYFNQY